MSRAMNAVLPPAAACLLLLSLQLREAQASSYSKGSHSGHLDDAVCAVQVLAEPMPLGAQQYQPRTEEAMVRAPRSEREQPDADGMRVPAASELRSESPTAPVCEMSASIYNYDVSVSYEAVSGGTKFTYTVAPAAEAQYTWASYYTKFYFSDCTCDNPDQFDDLAIVEYGDGNPSGSKVSFTPGCLGSTNHWLKYGDIDLSDSKSYFNYSFTLNDPTWGLGEVKMRFYRSYDYFNGYLCGPKCSQTREPTASPTRAPTGDSATSFGDPHVGNLKGEAFDILDPDYHTFLAIPRGSDEARALLHVVAKVDPRGPRCDGLMYVTQLTFTGRWLGEVQRLDFSTSIDGEMDAAAVRVKVGSSPMQLNVSQFRASVPAALAEVSEFQPDEPKSVNQHATTFVAKLNLGPSVSKVRMVYQKEKVGFSNSLWLTTTGLKRVEEEIGGILGLDDHQKAASMPADCIDKDTGDTLRPLGIPGKAHASASLDDWDDAI